MNNTINLTFKQLSYANSVRCDTAFHPLFDWTPADWAMATAGEMGEVVQEIDHLKDQMSKHVGLMCDAVKKLRRLEEGSNTAKDPQTEQEALIKIAREIADVVIYSDLLCTRLGISLEDAVTEKFNEVSDRMESEIKLSE